MPATTRPILRDADVASSPVWRTCSQSILTSGAARGAPVADTLPGGATEQEWILEGGATRYRLTGEYTHDGRWSAAQAETAPYRIRLLVERPDADRFNGVVVIIWNNVSAGFDAMLAGPPTPTMLTDGYALIGVSAQYVGVQGERGLVSSDPERYATLDHPGDDYSYDIFTQAVQAISGGHAADDVLGGLSARHVVVSGGSQSASRLGDAPQRPAPRRTDRRLSPDGLFRKRHRRRFSGRGGGGSWWNHELVHAHASEWHPRTP